MSLDVINHIEIAVTDAERFRRFHEAAPSPVRLDLAISSTGAVHCNARYGFGKDGYPSLWIHGEPGIGRPAHAAFSAIDRAAVIAFHKAAVAKGGTDEGGPGIRERYHPSYFAAYVLDPDGHNIEAVCQSTSIGRRPRTNLPYRRDQPGPGIPQREICTTSGHWQSAYVGQKPRRPDASRLS